MKKLKIIYKTEDGRGIVKYRKENNREVFIYDDRIGGPYATAIVEYGKLLEINGCGCPSFQFDKASAILKTLILGR